MRIRPMIYDIVDDIIEEPRKHYQRSQSTV